MIHKIAHMFGQRLEKEIEIEVLKSGGVYRATAEYNEKQFEAEGEHVATIIGEIANALQVEYRNANRGLN